VGVSYGGGPEVTTGNKQTKLKRQYVVNRLGHQVEEGPSLVDKTKARQRRRETKNRKVIGRVEIRNGLRVCFVKKKTREKKKIHGGKQKENNPKGGTGLIRDRPGRGLKKKALRLIFRRKRESLKTGTPLMDNEIGLDPGV